MATAVVVPTSGKPYQTQLGGDVLRPLQILVDGYIEALPTVGFPSGTVAYGNEEARVLGLPYNAEASESLGLTVFGTVVFTGHDFGQDVPPAVLSGFGLT